MGEHDTRELMSIDSFSQLPFIRPSPKPSTSPTSNSPIRLFGVEFPLDFPSIEPSSTTATDTNTITITTANTATAAAAASGETGRKFECHYCRRNFPTSQALGGHQNAHKRERQYAKRAHIQSVMAASHHRAAVIAGGDVYGFLNHHCQCSSPARQHRSPYATQFGQELARLGPPPPHYPSWNIGSWGGGPHFYSGLGTVSQPFNGSPLPCQWRVPNAPMGVVMHHDRPTTMSPLLGSDLELKAPAGGSGGFGSSTSSSSWSSASLHGQNPEEHSVSLDLHL